MIMAAVAIIVNLKLYWRGVTKQEVKFLQSDIMAIVQFWVVKQ